MASYDTCGSKDRSQPYRTLREHPRYAEIKRIIENFPPEKMHKLRSYIRQWLNSS
jgi:hypothetical protein